MAVPSSFNPLGKRKLITPGGPHLVEFRYIDNSLLATQTVAHDTPLIFDDVPKFGTTTATMVMAWQTAGGLDVDLRDNIVSPMTLTPKIYGNYNYRLFFRTPKKWLAVSEELKLDIMLVGSIYYSRTIVDVNYDTAKFAYLGYDALVAWTGSVTNPSSGKIAINIVPNMNIAVGSPCNPPVRHVMLRFNPIAPGATNIYFSGISMQAPTGLTANTSPAEQIGFVII